MSKRTVIIGASAVALLIGLYLWTIQTKKTPVPDAQVAGSPAVAPTTAQTAAPDPLLKRIDEIVGRYRKTIVLLEDSDSLPEAEREQASLVGKIIFQENHEAISSLSNDLAAELETAGDFS